MWQEKMSSVAFLRHLTNGPLNGNFIVRVPYFQQGENGPECKLIHDQGVMGQYKPVLNAIHYMWLITHHVIDKVIAFISPLYAVLSVLQRWLGKMKRNEKEMQKHLFFFLERLVTMSSQTMFFLPKFSAKSNANTKQTKNMKVEGWGYTWNSLKGSLRVSLAIIRIIFRCYLEVVIYTRPLIYRQE